MQVVQNMNLSISHNRRYDAVLFDLGSTLIYFDGDWSKVISQMDEALSSSLQESGLVFDGAALLNEFQKRLEAYIQKRETDWVEYSTAFILRELLNDWGYPDIPDRLITAALAAHYRVSQAYWKLETDAIPTLVSLQQKGYRLAMISNAGDDADVQTLVDNARIRSYFDMILTSAKAGIRKPNPRIFMEVLDRLGVRPERAVMVGDKLSADILGAQNAGIYSIWITGRADMLTNGAHNAAIHPQAVITTLSELPDLLEQP
jgi:HAD superfamily hydrolase (TIGR01549 family)